MRSGVFLLVFVAAIAVASPGGARGGDQSGDAAENQAASNAEWHPFVRTIGWGADKHSPVLRIKDTDREKPARDRTEWKQWRRSLGAHRSYQNSSHEELHARVFEETEALVADNLKAFTKGIVTYELGINSFADQTEEEFSRMTMGPDFDHSREEFMNTGVLEEAPGHTFDSFYAPAYLDYKDFFGPAKDQKGCGDCYIFSAIGAIEGQIAKRMNRTKVNLSEGYALNCAGIPQYNNYGCTGGWMDRVFKWFEDTGRGVPLAFPNYPYIPVQGDCPGEPTGEVFKLRTHLLAPKEDEEGLRQLVATFGPISVGMKISYEWNSYKSGILNNSRCAESEKNEHAVVIVGYGHEGPDNYFLLRNSWGPAWGEKGYIKIASKGFHTAWDWGCYTFIGATFPTLEL